MSNDYSKSDVDYIVSWIRNPNSIDNIYVFVGYLKKYKHAKFIDALISALLNCEPDEGTVWVCSYLYCLLEMVGRPWKRTDKLFSSFVCKLTEFASDTLKAERAWLAASLLGRIDHPEAAKSRLYNVNNPKLFIDGRIESLRGIVDFSPTDQVLKVLSSIAADPASPMRELSNTILSNLSGQKRHDNLRRNVD
jgi:hypothetical protein